MSREFQKTYGEFTKAYAMRSAQVIDIFARLDIKGQSDTSADQILFTIRALCHILTKEKDSTMQQRLLLANGVTDVCSAISKTPKYQKILGLLQYFIQPFNINNYIPLISQIKSKQFDLETWLRLLNTHLFTSIRNARIFDDPDQKNKKTLFLELTESLIVFVYAEAQMASDKKCGYAFKESRRFLQSCREYELFQDQSSNNQYMKCFDTIDKLLAILTLKSDDPELPKKISQYSKFFKSLMKSNELRATLAQDNVVVVSKILKACEGKIVEAVTSESVRSYMELLGYVQYIATQIKSDKKLCINCQGVTIHCADEITTVAIEIFSKLIESPIDSQSIELFATIIKEAFKAISKLSCTKTLETQSHAAYRFRTLINKCKSKQSSKAIVPVLIQFIKRFDRYKMVAGVSKFDVINFLNLLHIALLKAEQWDELIDVSYLLMAMISTDPSTNVSFDAIAYAVSKHQKDTNNMKTPFDHFSKVKKESYGVKLPDSFDLYKLSTMFISSAHKYNVISTEMSNKIVYQLLMTATVKDPSALRFALSVPSLKLDSVSTERTDKLIKSFNAKFKENRTIALYVAAIKYLRFESEMNELIAEHNSLSISKSLSDSDLLTEENIFRQLTMDYEKKQMDTMRFIKKRFIAFVEFHLSIDDEAERKLEEVEKEYLLDKLKILANQFLVRGYIDDALDSYMALWKFAKAVKNDFGIIDSCSMFAEYHAEFIKKFPNADHKQMIEEVQNIAMGKIKEIYAKTLSVRKQVQLCFCLLNMVLYHYENGAEKKQLINYLMVFTMSLLDGIGDKNMEDSFESTVAGIIKHAGVPNTLPPLKSDAARIKFYSVLFIMITKYDARSAFHPKDFINFVLKHLRSYLGLFHDRSYAIPALLLNMVPSMTKWMESNYDYNTEHIALLMTILKLSVRSGFVLRTSMILTSHLHIDLLSQKFPLCQQKFKAFENMMLVQPMKECKQLEAEMITDVQGNLCEPIRKHIVVTSPMKCLSPKRVSEGSRIAKFNKYILDHHSGCECGPCSSPQNRFQMFCVAVAYARYAYLNEEEFQVATMRSIFKETFDHWEKARKEKQKDKRLIKDDLYYLVSARFLLYYGHFQWKFEKDYTYAKELLTRSAKGLEKIKYGASHRRKDIENQIIAMTETIESMGKSREERFGGHLFFSRNKKFDDEPESECEKIKRPKAPVKARQNLLDLVIDAPSAQFSVFDIHDDDGGAATPSTKRTTRARVKKVEETPVRTPSTRLKHFGMAAGTSRCLGDVLAEPKTTERPKRAARPNHLIPQIKMDIASPPENATDQNTK